MSGPFALFPEAVWMTLPATHRLYGYLAQRCVKDTGTWHQSAREVADALDLKPDTVQKATRTLAADGLIVTKQTRRGDGRNGHLIYAVVALVPEHLSPGEAIKRHADEQRQSLAPDESSGTAPDESSGTAPDATSCANRKNYKNKNDKNKNGLQRKDFAPLRPSWGDIVGEGFNIATGDELPRQKVVGLGRVLTYIADDDGPSIARTVTTDALGAVLRGDDIDTAFRFATEEYTSLYGHNYSEVVRDEHQPISEAGCRWEHDENGWRLGEATAA